MPRFVRPAYMTLDADGVATQAGTGPRSREGWLSAVLTVRTPQGDVSAPVKISAGGTLGRVNIEIPAGFRIDTTPTAAGGMFVQLSQD